MAENKMKKVAQLLGVELDNPFKIKGYDGYFRLNENGLNYNFSTIYCNDILMELIIEKLEIEKPILDDVEKRYLENVLRPFKDNVNFIVKYKDIADYHYINVAIGGDGDNLTFPDFEKDTMYKGMKDGKKYTLKDLGLFED